MIQKRLTSHDSRSIDYRYIETGEFTDEWRNVLKWCINHFGNVRDGDKWFYGSHGWYFKNEDDATLFQLTWG